MEISLTGGYTVLIDDEDYPIISEYNWYAQRSSRTHYAKANRSRRNQKEGNRTVFMHRLLMDAPKHYHVDHIDGNGLNNTKANLRLCSSAQNGWNRHTVRGMSVYRGVSFSRELQKWAAHIRAGTSIYLGAFEKEEDAAKAYDEAARFYWGPYANLNFPYNPAPNPIPRLNILKAFIDLSVLSKDNSRPVKLEIGGGIGQAGAASIALRLSLEEVAELIRRLEVAQAQLEVHKKLEAA